MEGRKIAATCYAAGRFTHGGGALWETGNISALHIPLTGSGQWQSGSCSRGGLSSADYFAGLKQSHQSQHVPGKPCLYREQHATAALYRTPCTEHLCTLHAWHVASNKIQYRQTHTVGSTVMDAQQVTRRLNACFESKYIFPVCMDASTQDRAMHALELF